MTDIENKINMTVKKNIDENQKEYYLREKMKAIQEELGDKVKKESDIEELKEKILAKKMPKNIEEKCLYELQRYQSLPASSGESGVIRTYLDLLIDLPWHEESMDETDINKAEGEKYLRQNAKKNGIHVTSSGLQYKILRNGNRSITEEIMNCSWGKGWI